ncbi:hypothetical protein B0H14DRAFT_2602178 [Mycena olivaceomarginata]|nr:hypothetical protein B0H14DRAFT_2602178 [Mycena olivaceomarginata]
MYPMATDPADSPEAVPALSKEGNAAWTHADIMVMLEYLIKHKSEARKGHGAALKAMTFRDAAIAVNTICTKQGWSKGRHFMDMCWRQRRWFQPTFNFLNQIEGKKLLQWPISMQCSSSLSYSTLAPLPPPSSRPLIQTLSPDLESLENSPPAALPCLLPHIHHRQRCPLHWVPDVQHEENGDNDGDCRNTMLDFVQFGVI